MGGWCPKDLGDLSKGGRADPCSPGTIDGLRLSMTATEAEPEQGAREAHREAGQWGQDW